MTLKVNQSHGFYSLSTRRERKHNSVILSIGVIDIDIPQHPVVLHHVVYRSSRRLTVTLSEFTRQDASFGATDL